MLVFKRFAIILLIVSFAVLLFFILLKKIDSTQKSVITKSGIYILLGILIVAFFLVVSIFFDEPLKTIFIISSGLLVFALPATYRFYKWRYSSNKDGS